MSEKRLPTGGELVRRIGFVDLSVSIPALLIALFYGRALLAHRLTDWTGFFVVVGIYALTSVVVVEAARRKVIAPIAAYTEKRREGSPGSDVCRAAFEAAISAPLLCSRMNVTVWCVAALVVPLICMILGFQGWGLNYQFVALITVGVLGGMLSGGFVYFGAKWTLTETRMALASDLPDPLERASLVKPTSLSRKIQIAILAVMVSVSMVTISITYSQATRAVNRLALDWSARALMRLDVVIAAGPVLPAPVEDAAPVEIEPVPFGLNEALTRLFPDPTVIPFGTRFGMTGSVASAGEAALGGLDEGFESWLADRVEAEASRDMIEGWTFDPGRSSVVAWRKLADGRLLYARSDDGGGTDAFAGLYSFLGVALLVAAIFALGIAYAIATDFKHAVDSLAAEAERMAQGDLRRGSVWESEDEMGVLARSFERMGGALRATVARVAEATDRVDSAAGEIASVARGVAIASADQVRRIQHANELMVQIREQVAGVSDSAQALNISVEESSSSILELGAAGDELNDTASVLSSKVDEVSGSIEQMVRSVKEVGNTAESLSEAAADTSSSMEEMASAMRAVDTTAELTTRLSKDVVSLAESGQSTVSQTIEGMRAISDATDAAERVIRGLGARAKEIGGILDVIDDVADETNLLALNAAIIAAQAGEHGRAFSVVADEIKELADRVLASTKEIGSLIASVQAESENAIGAIEAGSQSVASGVELSAEAGTALEEINRASRESGERIGEIVVAVREQTKATVHVVTLMEAVRDGVEQISTAGAEQDRGNEVVFRSVVTMREVAQQVRRTTEEQSRGFGRIRESVEGVREAVENINGSLQEQTTACSQVAESLEQVFEGTRSNEEAAQRVEEAMQSLLAQAEILRADVGKFQI